MCYINGAFYGLCQAHWWKRGMKTGQPSTPWRSPAIVSCCLFSSIWSHRIDWKRVIVAIERLYDKPLHPLLRLYSVAWPRPASTPVDSPFRPCHDTAPSRHLKSTYLAIPHIRFFSFSLSLSHLLSTTPVAASPAVGPTSLSRPLPTKKPWGKGTASSVAPPLPRLSAPLVVFSLFRSFMFFYWIERLWSVSQSVRLE